MSKKVTIKEIAELFGVTSQTIYNWSHSDSTFPRGIRAGRKILFLLSDIEAWDIARFAKVSHENEQRRAVLMPKGR